MEKAGEIIKWKELEKKELALADSGRFGDCLKYALYDTG